MHIPDIDEPTQTDRELAVLTDEVIVERVRQGDLASYELIMRRYNQRLFRTARSILQDNQAAEDAVQEAYIAAYYKLDSYQSTGKLGAWLSRITVNEALMIKRKPGSGPSVLSAAMELETHHHTNPSEKFANKELAKLIENAIDALPDEFRSVFVLRAVQQLSVRETAASLDLKEATVKTRFLRAREKMQQLLNPHIEDAGLHAFEFAGARCDQMVRSVLHYFNQNNLEQQSPIRPNTAKGRS